jgi:hypothetical protein
LSAAVLYIYLQIHVCAKDGEIVGSSRGRVKPKTIQLVFVRQSSNFSAISWREQVNFQWDDDEFRFVLDQHAALDFYSASPLK